MPKPDLSLMLVALVLSAPSLRAQGEPDPIAAPVLVRVVGHDDGLPRPGVVLLVARERYDEAHVDAEGWLLAEDLLLRRLRASSIVRTDPNGRAQLAGPRPWQVHIGEPFFAWGPFPAGGTGEQTEQEWLVPVGQNEPVGVRVVDSTGAALAQFPVALHAAGKDLAIALTDDAGKAVLGVPKDFTARLVVAPAGWVGPKLALPSIAESLAGRRGVELVVPPYGSLRLRTVRGGVPVRGAVHAVSFFDPNSYAPLSALPTASSRDAVGITYDFVALGLDLCCYSPCTSGGLVMCTGPKVAGQCATTDVELGPLLTFRCPGLAADAPMLRNGLKVHAVTDVATVDAYARQNPEGDFEVDFRRAVPGETLLRVDFDASDCAASIVCRHSLHAAAIDLGPVPMVPHAPQLRGRVVDEAGVPVADAEVVVSATGAPNTGFVLRSDAEGRFRTSGALLRDESGQPVAVAKARHGELQSELSGGVEGEVTLTLRSLPPAGPPTKRTARAGRLVARVAGLRDDRDARSLVRLSSRFGVVMAHSATTIEPGLTEIVFEGLAAGRYSLLAPVPAPDFGSFVVLDDLDVPEQGACDDVRLQRLDCNEQARVIVVRVVDEQGVPVAGARIVGPELSRETDGTGTVRLCLGRRQQFSATIEAAGKRPQRREDWPQDLVITLEPEGSVQVRVLGLPEDLPRASLEVWLRDEVRERFAGPRARLGVEDTATMSLPARGRYVLHLLVSKTDGRGGWSGSTAHVEATSLEVGDARQQVFDLRLGEREIAHLRQLLQRQH